jgi:uncharacterized damage-inducible protein DinB
MVIQTISELFIRDLNKLKEELNLYPTEQKIWEVSSGISNSTGNLCLHIVGNLKYFIGAVLGKTGYIRERELEFSLKNIERTQLVLSVDETIFVIENTLKNLGDSILSNNYPIEKRGEIVSTDHMLLHLYGHLTYHLGQINYHRRMI